MHACERSSLAVGPTPLAYIFHATPENAPISGLHHCGFSTRLRSLHQQQHFFEFFITSGCDNVVQQEPYSRWPPPTAAIFKHPRLNGSTTTPKRRLIIIAEHAAAELHEWNSSTRHAVRGRHFLFPPGRRAERTTGSPDASTARSVIGWASEYWRRSSIHGCAERRST